MVRAQAMFDKLRTRGGNTEVRVCSLAVALSLLGAGLGAACYSTLAVEPGVLSVITSLDVQRDADCKGSLCDPTVHWWIVVQRASKLTKILYGMPDSRAKCVARARFRRGYGQRLESDIVSPPASVPCAELSSVVRSDSITLGGVLVFWPASERWTVLNGGMVR